ncbi:MAG TPA: PQQ-binding-like beta-propeller repeat protein [Acidimicrobiia bacterium]
MRRTRLGAVFAALLLVGVAAGCWPQEGFDASRSGFSPLESTLTAASVGGLTRAWGTSAGASTTPVVVGGSVFAGAGDAVEAFDTATGVVRWTTHNNDFESSGLVGVVGPLSAVGGDVLAPVNWGGLGGLFTFDDASGMRTGSAQFHSLILGSVAERSDASAIVGFSFGSGGPFITTLGYGTHQAILDFGSVGGAQAAVTSPTMIGRHVLVGVNNTIESFSLDTCVPVPPPLPSYYCAPEWSATVPAAPRDPAAIGTTAAAIGLANGDVAVLGVATGALQWTAHTGSTAATAPAVANGHLYVGAGDGHLYAFPTAGCGQATCAPEWSGATASGAAVSHQPAAAADVVYVGTSTGSVYAFAGAGCGSASCPSLWSGAVNPSGPAAPVAGPVVSLGTVYASAGGTVAAFRLAH